jgi:type II secretory pathway pseudopilin PulG
MKIMQTIPGAITSQSRVAVVLALALALAVPSLAAAVEQQKQQTFATPEAAVDALISALKTDDEAALVAIFGESHKDLVVSGDRAADAAAHADSAAELAAFHALDDRGADRRVLLMGVQAWPVPIPLVREGAAWRFATEEGVEELINRRIGGNERSAVHVLLAYLDAQREYALSDRNGDGVLEYAQKLASAPGKQDGLYWPADAANGETESPFGPLIAESSAYLAGSKRGDPYRGYHFRILTRQSANAPGGAYNYIINGRLVAGFAMVAYPAAYGDSGVMTFIVNHNGKVYQRDLGEATASIGPNLSSFDPGAGWTVVGP